MLRVRSLAARFLAIVLGGVLIPLALVGLWLTQSAERAGTTLLQSQLSDAAQSLSDRFADRWVLRDGELELLATNSSASAFVRHQPTSAADSLYLRDLVRGMQPAVLEVSYLDRSGQVCWSSVIEGINEGPAGETFSARADPLGRVFTIERAIMHNGAAAGTMRAQVRLSSVLPLDSAPLAVARGTITVLADSQRIWSSAPDTVDISATSVPEGWAAERRRLPHPMLMLIVAAPVESFVAPFKRVTRLGLSVLAAVVIVAFFLAVVLTSRVTRSLERLADAAVAVSTGDLDRTVDIDDIDEIGQVARAFNAMTVSLRGTLTELSHQRSLAAVGEFAATLSHEVRNSLTAVRVDLQHATRHVPRTESGGRLVGRALDAVHRLDATVTSALRVARGGVAPMVPVELLEVIDRAAQATAPVFAEREVTLQRQEPMSNATLPGDAAALEQLFINLLLNAAQALEQGGRVSIGVRLVSAPPGETVANANGASGQETIVVRIADNGPGMQALSVLATANGFRSTKPYGTGLGLPIARRITEMHGGTLTISSPHGGGTEVTVAFRR